MLVRDVIGVSMTISRGKDSSIVQCMTANCLRATSGCKALHHYTRLLLSHPSSTPSNCQTHAHTINKSPPDASPYKSRLSNIAWPATD